MTWAHTYLDRCDIEDPNYIGPQDHDYELGVETEWAVYPDEDYTGRYLTAEFIDWKITELCWYDHSNCGPDDQPFTFGLTGSKLQQALAYVKLFWPELFERWDSYITERLSQCSDVCNEAIANYEYDQYDDTPF